MDWKGGDMRWRRAPEPATSQSESHRGLDGIHLSLTWKRKIEKGRKQK